MGFMSPDDYNDLKAAGAAYLNAKTDAERQAAHAQAEAIRARYMYSGGDAGDQILALDQFPYNPYQNQYQEQIDEILDSILNRDPFSYNYLEDPLYQQYQEAYRREGDRAMQDAIGQVAARTGGLASSYAASAANQANNYYMAQLGDKIPELQQLAYSMYVDDRNYDAQKLQLLEELEQLNYGRWSDDMNFRYGIYRDNVSDSRYEDETAWERGQYESDTAYERALRKAETLAQFGNFSGYRELGYSDAEIAQMENAYKQAQQPRYTYSAGSSSSSGSFQKPRLTYEQTLQAIEDGRVTQAVISAYDYYMGEGAYEAAYPELEIDMESVINLGYGPISEAYLNQLVEQGEVEEYEENGKLKFRRKGSASTALELPGFTNITLPGGI